MKKSMCDGPEVRFSSKKCSGGCGCKKKCAKCSRAEEPDRDDMVYSKKSTAQVMTDAMDTHLYREDYVPACTPGNKPCGRRCIPQEQDCASTFAAKGKKRAIAAGALLGGAAGANVYGTKLIGEAFNKHNVQGDFEQMMADFERVVEKEGKRRAAGKGNFNRRQQERWVNAVAGRAYKKPGARKFTKGLGLLAAGGALGLGATVQGLRSLGAYGAAKRERNKNRKDTNAVIVTDAMTSDFRNDYVPACTPGNKPCGRRCIPQEQDCGKFEQKRLQRSAGDLALGSFGTYVGSELAGMSANAANRTGSRTFYPGQPGYKRVLANNALQKASLGLGVASIVQSVRAAKKKEENQSARSSKKRGDSIWADGFSGEPSESL